MIHNQSQEIREQVKRLLISMEFNVMDQDYQMSNRDNHREKVALISPET